MSEVLKVTVYSANNSSKKRGVSGLGLMFKELRSSNGLAKQMAKRDISAMYRQSILGVLWAFIIPVANACIWLGLQASGIIQMSDTGIPYPLYVFSGTLLWQIFVESLQSPVQQVASSKGVLSKLNFPREAIILAGIYKTLFNTGIKILILLPLAFYLGASPTIALFFLPLGVFSLILVGTSFGLLLAPIGTLYSDVGKIIPFLTQFLMFCAPVVFAIPKQLGLYRMILEYNILTPIIVTTRDFLVGGDFIYLNYFIVVNIISLAVLLIAWSLYRITMPILIERMSS